MSTIVIERFSWNLCYISYRKRVTYRGYFVWDTFSEFA